MRRGHAVAAWWFGQLKKRDYVTIIPDPKTGSLGHLRNPPRFISELENSGSYSGRAILQAKKFVVGCLAGNAASCHHRKAKSRYLKGRERDREQAIEVLSHLIGSNEELKAYFHLLQLRDENLVARFWPEVEAVAKRLLAEKTLTSEQIRRPRPCCEASPANGPTAHGED